MYSHWWIFREVSKLQFELFEKSMIADKFQIEGEDSYDYLLIMLMREFTAVWSTFYWFLFLFDPFSKDCINHKVPIFLFPDWLILMEIYSRLYDYLSIMFMRKFTADWKWHLQSRANKVPMTRNFLPSYMMEQYLSYTKCQSSFFSTVFKAASNWLLAKPLFLSE